MKNLILLAQIIIGLFFFGCSSQDYLPLDTVDKVDIQKYVGKWYEIARLPNSFQKDCYCSTAEYSIIDENTIIVLNKCREDSVNGEIDDAEGKAFVVENSNNAKLKVQFQWPFKGDYWIIDLDDKDYTYSVVGTPSRKYLWILSRSPKMDKELLAGIIARAKDKGFDVSKLIKSEQECGE